MKEKDPGTTQKSSAELSEQAKVQRFEELASIHVMLADLLEYMKENEGRLHEAEEMHEKMYTSRLPEALFHATTPAKAKRIMLEGLKPHKLEFEDDEVVSLSDTITFAKFCASITQNQTENELVVLEVTTQGLEREEAKSFLQMPNIINPGQPLHEVHYTKVINPDWIHELNAGEIADIQKQEKSNKK